MGPTLAKDVVAMVALVRLSEHSRVQLVFGHNEIVVVLFIIFIWPHWFNSRDCLFVG